LVGRTASLLAVCVALGVYYLVAESLPNYSLWAEVAVLSFLVIPAVFALVYFSLPLYRAHGLLVSAILVAVLAAVLHLVELNVLANFAKLAAVTLVLIIPWVDAISVWRGPTKHIVTHQRELFTTFSFAFPVPGEQNTAQLGLPDLMFFALFLAAAHRWGLRTKLTWVAMTLSFGATLALAVAFDIGGLPALPLLAFGFLLPNADLLWRRLRAEKAWGSLRSERSDAAGP
jgi:hypothetical protein